MKLLLLAFLTATTNAFTIVVCSPKDGATVQAAKEATVNQRAALGLTGPGYWNGNIQNCLNNRGESETVFAFCRNSYSGQGSTAVPGGYVICKPVFSNTPHVTTLENWSTNYSAKWEYLCAQS
ncbi:uncharacterized protein RSE6_14629 [Rhynchosporium secalis]|uniref:Secreted protein n=1 Tax=Rhynchosporium secalis TaxID=38038 RepID=A0A1E1MVU3_RHYSE|nr:uncharacterized protein RSE6_14629 [Rhynchosporium secalis]